ncbi:MAG: PVC-type heme-binding CxxCH protein [Phycisphaeraceae bacterium]
MTFRSVFILLIAGLAVQAADPPAPAPAPAPEVWTAPPALAAADSLKTIHVPQGFAIELVAAEPLVTDPVAIAWGPDGKLWVVEMTDYNHLPMNDPSPDKPKGRVVYLTDKNNDGTYDTRTVFLEGLNYPNGVLPWRKGVLITSAPDILYAEDIDNDGKADKREVLYTGFNEGNPQLRINGLAWGLDGWIYCANGLSHGVVKSTKTGATLDIRGRDLRIRPDTGELEAASGPSQFGRVRDDFGNWFGVDNSRLIIHYVLEDHYLRRNPHVPTPEPFIDLVTPRNPPCYPRGHKVERLHAPYMANRFTSACGIGIYRDTWLGDDMYGQVFVCEPVHNLVTRRKLTPDGVTFKAERLSGEEQSEFLTSTDEWFRPVQVRTGPDGALYVVDMYRAVIEHPQWVPKDFNKQVDWMQGKDKGRIYRVVKNGEKRREVPKLDTADRIIAALDSPNGTARDTAQMQLNNYRDSGQSMPVLNPKATPVEVKAYDRAMAERRKEKGKIVQHLERRLDLEKDPLAVLVQALCALDQIEGVSSRILAQSFIRTRDPEITRQAARISERLADGPQADDIGEMLADTLLNQVLLFRQANRSELQLVCSLGAFKLKAAGAALAASINRRLLDPTLTIAALSSARPHLDSMVDKLVINTEPSQIVSSNWAAIEGIAATAAGDRNDAVLLSMLGDVAADRIPRFRQWLWRHLATTLDAINRRGLTLEEFAKLGPTYRETVERVLPWFEKARAVAANEALPMTTRLPALRVIGRGIEPDAKDTEALLALLAPQQSGTIHDAVITALLAIDSKQAPRLLTAATRWKGLGPKVRGAVIDQLLRREAWALVLLDALESKQIAMSDVSTAQWQSLTSHKQAALRERAVKLHGSVKSNRAELVASHQDVLKLQGDFIRGRELFEKTCAVCHKLAGVGKGHAPDLSSLTDRSPGSLLTAILDPNQAVDPRYINYLAETSEGDTFTGMLLSETGASVMLVGADGTKHTVLRKDLLTLRSTSLSLMPEGLEQSLGKQGLADVIAFVISRSQPVRVLAGVKPGVVKPGRDGSLVLAATQCEAFGTKIAYEREDNNLGQWSNVDDYVVWMIKVKDAGKYEVWFDYACDDAWKGNTITLSAEDDAGQSDTLSAKVATTKTFNDFQQTKFGELELPSGQVRVTLRTEGEIKGRLMDLRSVRLVAVKK